MEPVGARGWAGACKGLAGLQLTAPSFCTFLQGGSAPCPGGVSGAGGRGLAGLSEPGNKEKFPFPACWNIIPLGWCELSSICMNCRGTVCLWKGERDSSDNSLQSFWNKPFRNYGLFFFNLFISVSESSLVYLFLKLMAYTWSKMLKCWFQQITQIIKPNFNNALQHY